MKKPKIYITQTKTGIYIDFVDLNNRVKIARIVNLILTRLKQYFEIKT